MDGERGHHDHVRKYTPVHCDSESSTTLMSLLTFLGLRQPKYNRTPLTLADILHRTFVSGLAALSIYGIYLGYSVHEHVMAKGKGVSRVHRCPARSGC